MFILKFKNYEQALSGENSIKIKGPNQGGSMTDTYEISIKYTSNNNQYISIENTSNKNPALQNSITLINISCIIIQDFILFTTTDKRKAGEINFVNFELSVSPSININAINGSKIIINENLEPEQLSFYILELLYKSGQTKTLVKTIQYPVSVLKSQQLTLHDLKSLLDTINMKAILDENLSLNVNNRGLINNNDGLIEYNEQSLDLNDYLFNEYSNAMFYMPIIGNHRKLIFGYSPELGFTIQNDSIAISGEQIIFTLKKTQTNIYFLIDKNINLFEIGIENDKILFQATFANAPSHNKVINLALEVNAKNTITIVLPPEPSILHKFEFFDGFE